VISAASPIFSAAGLSVAILSMSACHLCDVLSNVLLRRSSFHVDKIQESE
jgi:hypothetical protein